ncbi:MAG: hypothetical protein BGO14_01770 [Chlamydiales bacterium 38-26]|nr:acyl-CoA dehydrogenase family protein [Chlamydiales bacterium]OJV08175.1 MAG: hypothetical protein BGO14_01770 [Chlamydiales bacterium 38-26]
MNQREQNGHEVGREHLRAWQREIQKNIFQEDQDFKDLIHKYLSKNNPAIEDELSDFAEKVILELDPLVTENNLPLNLPRMETYDGIGQKINAIIHHPTYVGAGNIIYSSHLLERMAKPGGLLEALAFMFLSSQTGEAGHNCPLACSAGIIRVLQKIDNLPEKDFYIQKLIDPSYTNNYTGAQFLTEIQGGSDVGLNATEAYQDEKGRWRIKGEKWFCSNADAELILITARYNPSISGTKGLGLFLIPAQLTSGEKNHYTLRRLKDKIGTRSMASSEIDFHDAYAFVVGHPEEGFKLVMENVLHISRLFNSFCVIGMARRAYHIARSYAMHRIAFGKAIIQYPLVQENLAQIKSENEALLSSIFATTHLQDQFDRSEVKIEKTKLLLRLLANLNKYLSALWSVEHIHHSLDVLAGNGAIESFSIIPRLLRDSVVCENWEGTHNTLRMQILKDILKYHLDEIFILHIETLLSKKIPLDLHQDIILKTIHQLKEKIKFLKSSQEELQSLLIKDIVDLMAKLYGALHLMNDALDQMEKGVQSKKLCLDFFISKHFNDHAPVYDDEYLNLIKKIVQSR